MPKIGDKKTTTDTYVKYSQFLFSLRFIVNKLFPILIIYLVFFLVNCSFVRPADPRFRTKAIMNEEYTGFISRDFFQVVVTVDASVQEIPIQEKRKDCMRRSVPARNKITIPILLKESKDSENDRFRGINQIQYAYPGAEASSQSQSSTSPSLDTTPRGPIATPLSPPTKLDEPSYGDELFDKKLTYLQGEYSWFLNSFILYKEDYTNPKECIFIYRVAKKGLHERVENTEISIDWKEYK